MSKRRRWKVAIGTTLAAMAGFLGTLTAEALMFDWPPWVLAMGTVISGLLGYWLLRSSDETPRPPIP